MVSNCCIRQDTLHDGHVYSYTLWPSPSEDPLGSGSARPYASKRPTHSNQRSPHLISDYQAVRKEGKCDWRKTNKATTHSGTSQSLQLFGQRRSP